MARQKWFLDEETVRQLHATGYGNREIARRMHVPHFTVGRELRKLGLKTNVLRGEPPVPVDTEHSLCSKCGATVRNEDFPWVQGRADGRRLSYCRPCRSAQNRQNRLANPESYFREKTNRIRLNARGYEASLSDGHLLSLWEYQRGLCFYTDLQLKLTAGTGTRSSWGVSIDRIRSDLGYVEGNVVIAAGRVNSIKSDATMDEMEEWMPYWHERARRFLEGWRELGLTCLQVNYGDF